MGSESARRIESESRNELAAERVPAPIEWLLLFGNRWAVAAGLLAAVFVVLGVLVRTDVVAVVDGGSVTRSLSALIAGNLTLITIVISINQLILSRELSSPAELHERIREVIAYRQEVAETVGTSVSPATPDAFLDFLVTILREETVPLRDEVAIVDDEELRADLDAFTKTVLSQADAVGGTIEETANEPFETLGVVLDAGFATDLYDARRIRTMYGDELPQEAADRLGDIVEVLEHIGVARQYVKTLYLQRELASLSRKILFTGVPALVVLLVTTWVYGGESAPTVQGPALEALAVTAGTVAFAPLAVFFAYVLRIATITRRTAPLVPFTIQDRSSL